MSDETQNGAPTPLNNTEREKLAQLESQERARKQKEGLRRSNQACYAYLVAFLGIALGLLFVLLNNSDKPDSCHIEIGVTLLLSNLILLISLLSEEIRVE